jgi:hypothetical protein
MPKEDGFRWLSNADCRSAHRMLSNNPSGDVQYGKVSPVERKWKDSNEFKEHTKPRQQGMLAKQKPQLHLCRPLGKEKLYIY